MMFARALFLLLVIGPAYAADQPTCTPIEQWQAVPESIRQDLADRMGRIAEQGARFNATDVVSSDLANNRFMAACQGGDLTAVAIERGGRGYRIEVFHYRSGKVVKQWVELLDADGKAQIKLLEGPVAR